MSAEQRTDAPLEASCLHWLVEERARLQPGALAAAEGARRLRYDQLERDATRVARGLLALGVRPEERVGVLAERSLEYLVGILGVLKAGGAYLPLDPHQPDERIRFMRENGDARVVLAQRRLADRAGGPIVPIEIGSSAGEVQPLPRAAVGAESLAYVIYTSGSTGRPKGVMVEHRSVAQLVSFYRDAFGVTAADRFTQTQRPGFDGCVAEIFPALCSGASLHVPDEKTATRPARLMQWIADEGITICDVPTVIAEALFDEPAPPQLRLRALITGGDKLRRRPPPAFRFPVFDQYGPTENTVVTTIARVEPEGAAGPLHVGRPIRDHRVHVLDAGGAPVGPGEVGELYLGGPGLARGYLGDPALTAERFVADPFADAPGARLYRTGDLGRWLPSGDLEYLGRADHQVKIRGFRIELAEIEQRLAEHPAVREALVQAPPSENGSRRLVAHYLTRGAAPARHELRAFLAERLPNYMLPTHVVPLREWPLTVNGKIDRAALLADLGRHGRGSEPPVAPRNAVDALLVELWQELLGVRPIGIHDDFFELGGQSLIAAQIASRLERELKVDLPLAVLFQAPTVAEISDHVRGVQPIVTEAGLVPLTTRGSRPPLFLLPGLGGHVLAFRPLSLALDTGQPCFGLQDPALDGTQRACSTVEDMAAHFLELVRTVDPHGPYRLLGYSLGGLVAYEMAQQLARLGTPPAFLGLLDTPAPGFPPRLPLRRRLAVHVGNVVRRGPEQRRAYLRERYANVVRRFRASAQDAYEHEISEVLTPRMREVLEAHRHAGDRYQVRAYAGDLTLFRAAEHPDWPATDFEDPCMGWAPFVRGRVDVREVPGGHLGVLDEAHAPQLAEQVEGVLGALGEAREAPSD